MKSSANKKMWASLMTAILGVVTVGLCYVSAYAVDGRLNSKYLSEFSQNDILYYNPDDCVAGGGSYSSSVCGSTAKEIYWSALRKYFSETAAAGIFGNINGEGDFQPTGTESCTWLWSWDFGTNTQYGMTGTNTWGNGWTWERYLNNDYSTKITSGYPDGQPTGVGSVGITIGRSAYLKHINEVAPELMKYFQDPGTYDFSWCSLGRGDYETAGDALIAKIGTGDFGALAELEVEQIYTSFEQKIGAEKMKEFNEMNARDAAVYFARVYEVCYSCETAETQNKRASWGEAAYDEMKGFKCSAGSSGTKAGENKVSTVGTSNTDITWIGDSYSYGAYGEGLIQKKFPGADLGDVSDINNSYIWGGKTVNTDAAGPSGLKILKSVVDAGKLKGTLVFALGANGGWTQGNMDEFLNLVGNDTKVILVTAETYLSKHGIGGQSYEASNKILKDAAAAHSNIYVADWAEAYRDDYFDTAGSSCILGESGYDNCIHPTVNGGYDAWTDVILRTLTGWAPSGGNNTCKTSVSTGGGAIAETAMKLAWPESENQKGYAGEVTEAYKAAYNKWAGIWTGNENTSCTRFASLVIMESGADPDFAQYQPGSFTPQAGKDAFVNIRMIGNYAGSLNNYISESPNWEKVSDGNYKAGDIFIRTGAGLEHTFIYLGDGKIAEGASQSTPPNWGGLVRADDVEAEAQAGYTAYRVKGGAGSVTVGGSTNNVNETIATLAWPYEEKEKAHTEPTEAYAKAVKEVSYDEIMRSGVNDMEVRAKGMSCDVFVATAMRYSGVDPNYPMWLGNAFDHVQTSGDYTEVSVEEAKGGDVVFYFDDGAVGHTGIAYEDESGDIFIAEASHGGDAHRNSDEYAHIDNFAKEGRTTRLFRNKNNASSTRSNNALCNVCSSGASGGTGTGNNKDGFSSAEEADKVVMEPYRSLKDASKSELWKYKISLEDGGIENCVGFSRYFISKYTSIDFSEVPAADGGAFAKAFYDMYHDKYPDLSLTHTPTAYSIASCGAEQYSKGVYSHTFVVLGVSTSNFIVGEAGYNAGLDFIGAKTKSLDDEKYADSTCTYIDVTKYVTGL